MKKELRNYFLIFGNDYEDPEYRKRDYVCLGQIIFGIIIAPLFLVGWIIKKIICIKIKI